MWFLSHTARVLLLAFNLSKFLLYCSHSQYLGSMTLYCSYTAKTCSFNSNFDKFTLITLIIVNYVCDRLTHWQSERMNQIQALAEVSHCESHSQSIAICDRCFGSCWGSCNPICYWFTGSPHLSSRHLHTLLINQSRHPNYNSVPPGTFYVHPG